MEIWGYVGPNPPTAANVLGRTGQIWCKLQPTKISHRKQRLGEGVMEGTSCVESIAPPVILLPWLLHKKGNVQNKTKKSSPTEANTEISSSYTKAMKPVLIISWLCTAVQDNLGWKARRVLSRTAFWYSQTHHWGYWDLFAGAERGFWEEKQPFHKPVILTFLNLLTETFLTELKPENRVVSPCHFP